MSIRTSIEGSPKGDVGAERDDDFQQILQQVIAEVRSRHPGYTEEKVFDTAVHLAAYRLSKGRLAPPDPDDAA